MDKAFLDWLRDFLGEEAFNFVFSPAKVGITDATELAACAEIAFDLLQHWIGLKELCF